MLRGSPSYADPSGLRIWAIMRIDRAPPARKGSTWAVSGTGNATMSLSWIRL